MERETVVIYKEQLEAILEGVDPPVHTPVVNKAVRKTELRHKALLIRIRLGPKRDRKRKAQRRLARRRAPLIEKLKRSYSEGPYRLSDLATWVLAHLVEAADIVLAAQAKKKIRTQCRVCGIPGCPWWRSICCAAGVDV